MSTFEVGSLVRARGREWVVLPESAEEEDLLVLRPLGGTEDEVTGVYLPLEPEVSSAEFSLPDPREELGNHRSGALLRNAVRLGFRSGAGPFRSLGRIAVEPRPYQLVPLLMALRLDPVRLMIADDVGIGKTVEACLIARELLDRAEIQRFTVLCPPHLADQWVSELSERFHLDPTLVLPGTARTLERDLPPGESLFEHHPVTVVSLDYIKSDRRRHEFLRSCPELVIVDEAHTCSQGAGSRMAQRRHELLDEVMRDDPTRHLLLVTATPHSGKEANFRSLLGLLDQELLELPEDLSGERNRRHRERLARHLVQRRRKDLRGYLEEHTPFPRRETAEEAYSLHADYRKFFDRVLAYCRERIVEEGESRHRQRVQWWSALALLRSLGSSPEAAAATLENRAAPADAETEEEADRIGRRTVLDVDEETVEGIDVPPGSQVDEPDEEESEARRLKRMAREARELAGEKDAKLTRATDLVRDLLDEGFHPILFCRYIPTVHYVAEQLRAALGADVRVEGVTGELVPEERERRVRELGSADRRVLVCTDCLSEGINLQEWFTATLHYDLTWNPTRHEQREGRVDRFGQQAEVVRTLTYYGHDNPVDGVVLDVLLRKHRAIHKRLGIHVPVPLDTDAVVEAILEGVVLRGEGGAEQLTLDIVQEEQRRVDVAWEDAADKEEKSRSLFAQHRLDPDEVAREIREAREALGDEGTVRSFTVEAVERLGGAVVAGDGDRATLHLGELPPAAREALGTGEAELPVGFRHPVPSGAAHLTRTHPLVSGLAGHVLESALDPAGANGGGAASSPARRCAVIRTADVERRTTLLLLRHRYHILTRNRAGEKVPLLAEEAVLAAFEGPPDEPEWLDDGAVPDLLGATPSANVPPDLARGQLEELQEEFAALRPELEARAKARGEDLLEAHRRVRKAAAQAHRSIDVEAHLPVDVLGMYVYLPQARGVPA